VLDALREPLEEGVITIARARGHVRYPARFQLVAAMNPCRCGNYGSTARPCRCAPGDAERYVARVSGPFLDRVDLRVEMARVPPEELLAQQAGESSSVVAQRIVGARARQRERAGRPNAVLSGSAVLKACALSRSTTAVMAELAAAGAMTARGVHRVLRVARTIADLDDRTVVEQADLLAAAALRDPAAPWATERAA
jgi:magnesium chelatase family protein